LWLRSHWYDAVLLPCQQLQIHLLYCSTIADVPHLRRRGRVVFMLSRRSTWFDGEMRNDTAITVAASGKAPFDSIIYHGISFDALLKRRYHSRARWLA
jgi:hypothetical protein